MKKMLLIAAMTLCSGAAFAQDLDYEVGYTNVNADGGGVDVDLGAIYGTIGYELNTRGNYTNALEGTLILGVADDNVGAASIDLEPTIEVGYRGTYQSNTPDLNFFWRASYTRIELEASSSFGGGSFSDSESGAGLGIGAEWRGFTLGYHQYFGDLDDFSRISIGYRF